MQISLMSQISLDGFGSYVIENNPQLPTESSVEIYDLASREHLDAMRSSSLRGLSYALVALSLLFW